MSSTENTSSPEQVAAETGAVVPDEAVAEATQTVASTAAVTPEAGTPAAPAPEDARVADPAGEADVDGALSGAATDPAETTPPDDEPGIPGATAVPAPGAAPAPRAPAPAPAPEPARSVPEFSAGALGEAINVYRAQNGLPAMSISRSGGLVAHAAAMAEAGSIWHSGSDKIVGYVMPSSASALVDAWAASPPHNAWMLRTDKSAMQVGAVVLNDRLYGAVNFS